MAAIVAENSSLKQQIESLNGQIDQLKEQVHKEEESAKSVAEERCQLKVRVPRSSQVTKKLMDPFIASSGGDRSAEKEPTGERRESRNHPTPDRKLGLDRQRKRPPEGKRFSEKKKTDRHNSQTHPKSTWNRRNWSRPPAPPTNGAASSRRAESAAPRWKPIAPHWNSRSATPSSRWSSSAELSTRASRARTS